MIFPFGNLNTQKKILAFISNNSIESKNSNSSLILKPPSDLALLFNQFNNVIPENNSDTKNGIQSKYYDINKLLQSTNIHCDVIAMTETQISKNSSVTQNIELNNYSFEHTPTKTSARGTLLYVANHLSYKTYSDLNIYKIYELESTFIKIINHQKIQNCCWHNLQKSKNGCD